MTNLDRIMQSLLSAVDELNQGLPREKRLVKTPETVLYGKHGALDSLGLVNLIVLSEQRIQEEFGCLVSLADERAMSLDNSPFRTIGSMADYVALLLKEKGN